MRKCVGVLMLFTFLLGFGTTAQATRTWVSGNVGNWSDTANWSGGALPTAETAQIDAGNVTVNSAQSTQQLLMGVAAAGGTAVLNISSNLTSSKASAELFALVKTSNAAQSTTVNHSAGTVSVFQPGYTGLGETRLVSANTTAGTAAYNLSGTAVLDTEIFSKGSASNSSATFNATGGTLVIRNMIYRFGLISAGAGFNQGSAKLEVGAIDTVKAITFGNATNSMDYTDTAGTIALDIASASSFDTILQYGTIANTLGAALDIGLLGGYTPTAGATFDVWTSNGKTAVGSGTFAGITAGWSAAWVDTDSNTTLDTLRLTYIPEPATIALLGLGLLAIRRNKK